MNNSNNTRAPAADPGQNQGHASPCPAGVDVVAGEPPVPGTLWRTAMVDGDEPGELGARLAAAIVSSYTRHGDLVLDATRGARLAGACADAGRDHASRVLTARAVSREAALLVADLDDRNGADPRPVLAAAAHHLRAGGCLILVEAAAGGPVDRRPLHALATALGLGYFQHIVAVTAQVDGDRFVYYPTRAELAAATGPDGSGHVRIHRDLRVYLRAGGDAHV